MSRITFGYPPWSGEYKLFGWLAKRSSQWPPLNLALLASICEERGYEARIIDGEVSGLSKEQMARKIIETEPDFVAFSMYSPFAHLSADVAAEVKKLAPELRILVGGPHATIMREKAMQPQFDYLFMGEAERSLPDFLDAADDESKIAKIGGIIYRKNGELMNTGEAQWLTEISTRGRDVGKYYPLDALPLPARHLLPMEKYRLGTIRDGRQHFSSIQSFRGCPWRCIFCCSDKLKTTRVIMKSPKRVIEEMVDTVVRWPFITHFYIVDDVLTLYPAHILEIVERMDAEGLRVTFEGSTRANLVTDDLMRRLAKSGLIRLSFGLETIDPVMRVTMGKKVPLQAYVDANKICNRYGIEALNSLMIGLPGETRATVQATLKWVSESRDIAQANLAIAVPYPGTEFSEMAINGTHGIQLLDESFEKYLRYGNAVTNVGDLKAQDLVDLQNDGFARIYSKPWRWRSIWKKYGTVGFSLQMLRILRMWRKRLRRWRPLQPVMRHPKEM